MVNLTHLSDLLHGLSVFIFFALGAFVVDILSTTCLESAEYNVIIGQMISPPARPLSSFPVSVATLSTLDVQILTHPSRVHDAFWKLMPG
jgi:hypothetical protein